MGLKGYRLWVMGQLDSNVRRPTVVREESGAKQHPTTVTVPPLTEGTRCPPGNALSAGA
jgi:hypothetical protein